MPKNQFTQADFEESVRQRWLTDNLKAAIKLIDWNRKVNAEIEEKQKQEQEKLEQQKLKDLKQEQQKASSSSTNTEQSPTKATGARPKQKEPEKKRCKKKYKENREQKNKEQQQERDKQAYSNFKDILDQYFEDIVVKITAHVLIDIKDTSNINMRGDLFKKNEKYEKQHMNHREKLRFCIKGYVAALMCKKLLHEGNIGISYTKLPMGFQEELISNTKTYEQGFMSDSQVMVQFEPIYKNIKKNNAKETFRDKFYKEMQTKLSKYGVKIPDIRYSDVPDIENIEKVENDLTSEINTLVKKDDLYPKEGAVMPWGVLSDRRNFTDICEFLDNIMKKNNYLIDMDSLVKKYQPNSSVEEASTKPNSTREVNDQTL
ncbi:hypothetical protein [Candidatus Mesenet endosymbiont of Phosphuga atrata]|uniref:hypothetical protein n=1 Tax=Candidatus Mesenet endosymbiont of Phosphuga atrata TaxID=3066221 RepID=UPI0030D549FA